MKQYDEHTCAFCGDSIFENSGLYEDDYYELGGQFFHKDCVGRLDVFEVLDLLQISPIDGFYDGQD